MFEGFIRIFLVDEHKNIYLEAMAIHILCTEHQEYNGYIMYDTAENINTHDMNKKTIAFKFPCIAYIIWDISYSILFYHVPPSQIVSVLLYV